MSDSETEYFAHRADAAREAAIKAKGMASFRAHMGMAQEYERRARGFEPRHADKVVLDGDGEAQGEAPDRS